MGTEAVDTRGAGIVGCWDLSPSFAGAEEGCGGSRKGKRGRMQRCTLDLKELGQPLDGETTLERTQKDPPWRAQPSCKVRGA